MDFVDYRKRLGLGFDDKEKNRLFISKMKTFFDVFDKAGRGFVSDADYTKFCLAVGKDYGNPYSPYDNYELIKECLLSRRNIADFLSYYIIFCNSLGESSAQSNALSSENYIAALKKNLHDSHIEYDIIQDGDGIFIFPKGAKELDDALVSDVLCWLQDYPRTRGVWVNALKRYADEDDYSNVADYFRKALELFFKEFFNSNKSLENLKKEFGDFLKRKGVPAEISNHFENTLQLFTNYNNNYGKHGTDAEKNVLEFIMYQSGNIMRLLLTLNQGDEE